MHVLQWIAVQADDKDMAFRSVKDYLETNMGTEYNYSSWYDWFVTGGGRWNPNEGSQYDDNDQSMVISYDEEPQKFREAIEGAIASRKAEFDRYVEHTDVSIIDKVISDYDPSKPNFEHFQKLYELKKVIDMAYGEWDFNSYYFDSENDTTTPKYMFESIDNGNKNWYAVPVDFHF